jgi:hypothetical protein
VKGEVDGNMLGVTRSVLPEIVTCELCTGMTTGAPEVGVSVMLPLPT